MDPQHQKSWKFQPAADLAGTEKSVDDSTVGRTACDSIHEAAVTMGAPKCDPDASEASARTGCSGKLTRELDLGISEKSRLKIQSILNDVNVLMPAELLFLYLRLPTETGETPDPLRQPLNPLGSRSEINQTITWIKTHLEEDPDISLQKKGVYEEYRSFCELNNIKSLSTADFGKVMKQVYPKVRPRRLGTRGNSQYCYSGLRKRGKLPAPILPDLSDRPMSTEPDSTTSELLAAAWAVIKEWADGQLGAQFFSPHSLAYHLVVKCSVGVGTQAASIVTARDPSTTDSESQLGSKLCINRHRETTLQLQRKLQQKSSADNVHSTSSCGAREQKRKIQLQSSKAEPRPRGKKCRTQSNQSTSTLDPLLSSAVMCKQPEQVCDKSLDYTTGSGQIVLSQEATPSMNAASAAPVINQLQALPDFSSFQRQQQNQLVSSPDIVPPPPAPPKIQKETNSSVIKPTVPVTTPSSIEGKIAIPRLLTSRQLLPGPISPCKRVKGDYKAIQPKPMPSSTSLIGPILGSVNISNERVPDTPMFNPQHAAEIAVSQIQDKSICARRQKKRNCNGTNIKDKNQGIYTNGSLNDDTENKKELSECDVTPLDEDDGQPIHFSRERLISISKVSKDEIECYLNTSSSQEHEEELEKYFENNNSTSQQPHIKEEIVSTTIIQPQQDNTTKQLSQVRQLLEQNFSLSQNLEVNTSSVSNKIFMNQSFKSVPTTPCPMNMPLTLSNAANARRRVSFDTPNFVDSVPPSPNTRCQNLNFTPISPGTKSPPIAGLQSKCSSNNVSPFVSPRNTPVPRARGNSHPYPVSNSNTPIRLLNVTNARKHLKGAKMKPELELKLDRTDNMNMKSNLHYINQPMSAPPSPQMKLLQSLLQSRVNYTEYAQSQNQQQLLNSMSNIEEASSPELWASTLPDQQTNSESQFRSQSVPLPAFTETHFTHFSFDIPPVNNTPSVSVEQIESANEFNDMECLPGSENINVNKIIDDMENMITTSAIESMIDEGELRNVAGIEEPVNINLVGTCPMESRWINRSQSLDIDEYNVMKNTSSRSVPATPIPYAMRRRVSPEKIQMGNSSRSYPSTPLNNDTFSYTQGHDFLLNGQPIKEKVSVGNMNYVGNNNQESATLTAYGGMISDGNEDILLVDNKVPFSVGGQMVPVEGCDIMGSEYNFESVSDLNGS